MSEIWVPMNIPWGILHHKKATPTEQERGLLDQCRNVKISKAWWYWLLSAQQVPKKIWLICCCWLAKRPISFRWYTGCQEMHLWCYQGMKFKNIIIIPATSFILNLCQLIFVGLKILEADLNNFSPQGSTTFVKCKIEWLLQLLLFFLIFCQRICRRTG